MLTGFIIWAACGAMFVLLGVYCLFAKKPCGFWANVKEAQVKDVRGYNRAMALLWIAFGVVFALLGLPMLDEENPAMMMFSCLGVMAEAIAAMIVYTTVIDKKYRGGKK